MSTLDSEILVPWGHISVKAWGSPSDIPVLVIHGIQDNSSSFDSLIPLLPKGFYFHCIDLPGHGKSSPFPPGMPLYFFNYVYSVKLVAQYLKWEKFIIMGHSLGAHITTLFTSLYPERVERCILIEGSTPTVTSEDDSISKIRDYFDSLHKLDQVLNSKSPPSYTYDEALNRLISNRNTNLRLEAAKNLLARSIVPSGKGYKFSADQRLKLHLKPILTMKQMSVFVQNIKCPVLMILAKDTYDGIGHITEEFYHERLHNYILNMTNFKIILVEGNHDVHMNHPNRLAPYVSDFLLKSIKSSL